MSSIRTARQPPQGPTRPALPRVDGNDNHHTCQYRDQLHNATDRIAHLQARLDKQRVADRLSIPQVVEQVQALNKVIEDTVSTFSKAMGPQEYPAERITAGIPVVTEYLGPNVPSILVVESRNRPPTTRIRRDLVNVVIQICLVHSCARLISEWCPGDKEKSRIFEAMYGQTCSTEDDLVAFRWRAITHSCISINLDTWKDGFLADIRAVLAVAGWQVASEERRQRFLQNLTVVFQTAWTTRRALGEKVISTELQIVSPVGGTKCGSNAARDETIHPDERIIGSTTLGLEDVGGGDVVHISSAEVITETSLREGLGQTPSKRSQVTRGAGVSSESADPGASHTGITKSRVYETVEQRAIRRSFRALDIEGR